MSPVSPIRLKTLVERSEVIDLASPAAGIEVALAIRLRLFDAHAVLQPADAEAHPGDLVTLTAPLPEGPGLAELVRQAAGIRGRLASLREQKLGVKVLDDAFVIHCDDNGFSVLGRCQRELEALLPCPGSGRVHIGPAQLIVTWDIDRLDGIAHLWERVHALRIGA